MKSNQDVTLQDLSNLFLKEDQVPIQGIIVMRYMDKDGVSCLGVGRYGSNEPTSELGILNWAEHKIFEDMIND